MKKREKLMALALAGAMVLSLAACGGDSSTASTVSPGPGGGPRDDLFRRAFLYQI